MLTELVLGRERRVRTSVGTRRAASDKMRALTLARRRLPHAKTVPPDSMHGMPGPVSSRRLSSTCSRAIERLVRAFTNALARPGTALRTALGHPGPSHTTRSPSGPHGRPVTGMIAIWIRAGFCGPWQRIMEKMLPRPTQFDWGICTGTSPVEFPVVLTGKMRAL